MAFSLNNFLAHMVSTGGSDLLLASGYPPAMRIYGRLEPASAPPLTERDLEDLIKVILLPQEYDRLRDEYNLDFAYECDIPGVGVSRFRCNAYFQCKGLSVVFRVIPWEPPSLDDLSLPEVVAGFTSHRNGLVLVTGPTGCGKTSTLAAMCRYVNEHRAVHMVMIEDPIEYVHHNCRAMIIQRQVGVHVESFQRALTASLREDPDVIVVGELRDLETIQLALTAAETGHLVLSTLHTTSAQHTISRIIGTFPSMQQWQVRTMLADSLRAIISQQLLPRIDGKGLVPAVELLVNTDAVANVIREDKYHQITSIMESSTSKGMRLMDKDLLRLVDEGLVDPMEALNRGHDKHDLAARLEVASKKGTGYVNA